MIHIFRYAEAAVISTNKFDRGTIVVRQLRHQSDRRSDPRFHQHRSAVSVGPCHAAHFLTHSLTHSPTHSLTPSLPHCSLLDPRYFVLIGVCSALCCAQIDASGAELVPARHRHVGDLVPPSGPFSPFSPVPRPSDCSSLLLQGHLHTHRVESIAALDGSFPAMLAVSSRPFHVHEAPLFAS